MRAAVLETSRNRYVVGEFLTEGGMGAIYLGKRVHPDGREEDVVLKALLPEFTSEPHFVDLFLREAKLTALVELSLGLRSNTSSDSPLLRLKRSWLCQVRRDAASKPSKISHRTPFM